MARFLGQRGPRLTGLVSVVCGLCLLYVVPCGLVEWVLNYVTDVSDMRRVCWEAF